MTYHVLPGDSLVKEFERTGLDGEIIVCRECLIVGDVDAETLPEFWEQRARFILSEYGEDEIEYHDNVADELAKLSDLDDDSEVNLWFEYDLFCSVNMWFCLWLLSETGVIVYRVEPSVPRPDDRWKGFGKLDAADLQECFDARNKLTTDDIKLGSGLWNAYRKNDHARLRELVVGDLKCFPYLRDIVAAEIEKNKKPKQILNEIIAEGITEFIEIFAEFTKRAGIYGFGDIQVQRIMESE